MADRRELMEAALDCYPEGIALTDADGHVVFWNRAAESISGFPSLEVVGRSTPWAIEPLLDASCKDDAPDAHRRAARGLLVHAQHKRGADLTAMVRTQVLRDELGVRIGSVVAFREAEQWDALPCGAITPDSDAETMQARVEERVEELFNDFERRGVPFGLLWITVDQAEALRKTHGGRACEAMLERMERTLSSGLRPGEELGRWGDDEFLVISHESTGRLLAAHAQALAGLARTTEFRWWGDRVSLTVSLGAAHAERNEPLVQLLERAQAALHASMHAGGNHITLAPGRRTCSPS